MTAGDSLGSFVINRINEEPLSATDRRVLLEQAALHIARGGNGVPPFRWPIRPERAAVMTDARAALVRMADRWRDSPAWEERFGA